jgi:hypothetical protein
MTGEALSGMTAISVRRLEDVLEDAIYLDPAMSFKGLVTARDELCMQDGLNYTVLTVEEDSGVIHYASLRGKFAEDSKGCVGRTVEVTRLIPGSNRFECEFAPQDLSHDPSPGSA